jgi:hypothetical protein
MKVNLDLAYWSQLLPVDFTMPTKQQIREAKRLAKAEFGVNFLLSIDADPKTRKSNRENLGYHTAIQYLAPARESGYQTCASASPGCVAECLHKAGNPAYLQNKIRARVNRTKLLFERREVYFTLLYAELCAFRKLCLEFGLKPAVRLNGTSDIVWESVAPWIFKLFGDFQFYDYTKHVKRFRSHWQLPVNYDLTFSRSEDNEHAALYILQQNPLARVAVVFSPWRTKPLPATWAGYEVGDADKHDLRFLDSARIAGLRAKGPARHDMTGFVVQV